MPDFIRKVFYFEDTSVPGYIVCHLADVLHENNNGTVKLRYTVIDANGSVTYTINSVPHGQAWKAGQFIEESEGATANPVCTDGGMSSFR